MRKHIKSLVELLLSAINSFRGENEIIEDDVKMTALSSSYALVFAVIYRV